MASKFEQLPGFACDEVASFVVSWFRPVLATLVSKTCNKNFAPASLRSGWLTLYSNEYLYSDRDDAPGCRLARLVLDGSDIRPNIWALGNKSQRLEIDSTKRTLHKLMLLPSAPALPNVTALNIVHMLVTEPSRLAELLPNVRRLEFVAQSDQLSVDFSHFANLQQFCVHPFHSRYSEQQKWQLHLPDSVTYLKLHPRSELVEFNSSRVQRLHIIYCADPVEWSQEMRPSEWPSLTELTTRQPLAGMLFRERWPLKRLRLSFACDAVLEEFSQSTGDTLQSLSVIVETLPLSFSLRNFSRLETLELTSMSEGMFKDLCWPPDLRRTLRTLKLVLTLPVGEFDSHVLTQFTNLEHLRLGPHTNDAYKSMLITVDVDALQPLQNLKGLHLCQVNVSWHVASFWRLQNLTLWDIQGFDWGNPIRFDEHNDLRRLNVSGSFAANTPEFHSQLCRFTRLEYFGIADVPQAYRAVFRKSVPPSCCIDFY